MNPEQFYLFQPLLLSDLCGVPQFQQCLVPTVPNIFCLQLSVPCGHRIELLSPLVENQIYHHQE